MLPPLTLHELELPCPATAHSNVPDPSLLDDPMQSLHGLLDRSVLVESVALKEIDVIESKSLERSLDGSDDSLELPSARSQQWVSRATHLAS